MLALNSINSLCLFGNPFSLPLPISSFFSLSPFFSCSVILPCSLPFFLPYLISLQAKLSLILLLVTVPLPWLISSKLRCLSPALSVTKMKLSGNFGQRAVLRQSHRNAKLHINISNERQLAEKLLHWPPRIERQIERCKKANRARQGGIQEAGGEGRKRETSTHTTRHTPGHTHTHTLTRMSAQKKSHLNADYNKGRAFCS